MSERTKRGCSLECAGGCNVTGREACATASIGEATTIYRENRRCPSECADSSEACLAANADGVAKALRENRCCPSERTGNCKSVDCKAHAETSTDGATAAAREADHCAAHAEANVGGTAAKNRRCPSECSSGGKTAEGEAVVSANRLHNHPCFSESAHGHSGRMHIPCAPRCNLNCAFCGGGMDDGRTQLPGRAMTLVTAETVEAYVSERLARHPEIAVLGIAGPGEPLFNEETFRVLERLGRCFPEMLLCVGTNGFFLPESAARLARLGVQTLTVTVNAVSPEVGAQLNPFLTGADGALLEGEAAARELFARQKEGIFRAAQLGMTVKVNSVCVPGVNDGELRQIAETVRDLGASIMNVMPLRPAGRLRNAAAPSPAEIHRLRAELEEILPQLHHCYQCRADACGIPGCDEIPGGCAK